MRLLFAWELGSSLGHVLKLRPLLAALRARGHETLLALKDVAAGPAAGVPFVQAPMARTRPLQREICSYADILAVHGCADAAVLQATVQAWQQLYTLYRPDAVVGDHAPLALLAAHLAGLPALAAGTGFELPPAQTPLPCFRPWLPLDPQLLPAMEASLLANVNALCAAQDRPAFTRLSDMVCAPERLLLTFPALDHYEVRGDARYLGPLFTLDAGAAAAWPQQPGKKIFVYLHAGAAGLPQVLDVLGRLQGANVVCAVPGIAEEWRQRYARPHLDIRAEPVRLDALLPQCDAVVAHGGHGLAAACLLHGVPMLLLPQHVEQLMLARRIAQQGMGLAVLPDQLAEQCGLALLQLINTPAFAEQARRLRAQHAGHDQDSTVRAVVAAIEARSR